MYTLEVLDPNAQTDESKAKSAAPRPASLDNLTLGLLWNAKRGGEIALAKTGELVKQKYRNVKVIRYDGSMPCEKELIAKAKQECDIFIGSSAD